MKILIALLFSINTHASPGTYTHIFASSSLTFGGLDVCEGVKHKELKVAATVFAVGLLKETLVDKKFDSRDVVANWSGIMLTLVFKKLKWEF